MHRAAYLHLLHELKHLFRRQTGHSSADGLWSFLWLDTVSIRRLDDGSSGSQTCRRTARTMRSLPNPPLNATKGCFSLKLLTFELFLVFLTRCIVHTQSPAAELPPIQVTHGTEGRLLILVLTESISLWLSCLPVIH